MPLLLVAVAGCTPQPPAPPAKPVSPAKVDNPVKESDLATITLTPQAEQRLQIECVPVQSKPMLRTRLYGGDIMVPTGRAVTLSAPLAGTMGPPVEGPFPAPGHDARSGAILARLTPAFSSADASVLPPSERINLLKARSDLEAARSEAHGQVESARVRVDAARTTLERALQLHQDKAGSEKAVEDARAAMSLAQSELQAASRKWELLNANQKALSDEGLAPLTLAAPFDGIIRSVYVASGQVVPAGAPLLELISVDPVWVRVPVYAGEWRELNVKHDALVGQLNAPPGGPRQSARLLDVPPPGAAGAQIQLYFELKNSDRRWMPGERVAVTLSLKDAAQSLVVPWAGVVVDIHGGTWVYENTAPHVFVRRRVSVRQVSDDLAALDRGPAPGAKIVVAGAAELFGTEFGIGK